MSVSPLRYGSAGGDHLGCGPEIVATVGLRWYNSTQMRAAVAQRISTDTPNTIFVTGFGHQNDD